MEPLMVKEIPIWMSFVYGLMALINPCVFPVVPFFLENLSRKNPIRSSLMFSMGFCLTFSVAGVGFACLSSVVERVLLSKTMGVVIIFLGALYLVSFKFPGWRLMEIAIDWEGSSALHGVVVALAWIPCSSPVLACALGLISSGDIPKALLTMLLFSLGIVLPFLALGRWISDILLKVPQRILRVAIGSSVLVVGVHFLSS